jgi:hypothetical protein
MNQTLFYILSWTWGLPMSLIGFCASGILKKRGYKSKKHGWCYYYECGRGWGGVNFGPIFITSTGPSEHTKNHEHGHALQNCIWGPLMPFVIAIPSAVRYWIRRLQAKKGQQLEDYDAIWFEGQATKWGDAFMKKFKEQENGDN